MPKSCDECRIMVFEDTNCLPELFCGCPIVFKAHPQGVGNRPDYCPLVEVPTPRGRLTDADVLKTRVQKLQEWLWDKLTDADVGIVTADDVRYRIAEEFEEFIDDAPTIIESEGE